MKRFMVYGGGVILAVGDSRPALERWIEKDAAQRCEGYYTIFENVAQYAVRSSAIKTGGKA